MLSAPPAGVAVATQDATAAALANAAAGTLNGAGSAVQLVASGGMLFTVGATPHVLSVVSESVKVLVAHEPAAAAHEHVQLGAPSPLTTFRSAAVSPDGHVGRDVAAKAAAAHPSGAA